MVPTDDELASMIVASAKGRHYFQHGDFVIDIRRRTGRGVMGWFACAWLDSIGVTGKHYVTLIEGDLGIEALRSMFDELEDRKAEIMLELLKASG